MQNSLKILNDINIEKWKIIIRENPYKLKDASYIIKNNKELVLIAIN
jgi:hypothetical protein